MTSWVWGRVLVVAALVVPVALCASVGRAGAYDYRAVKLLDSVAVAAGAYAVGGGKQYGVQNVGSVNSNLHATVWSGQADVYTDLGPGWVNDALGTSFAGSAPGGARLWSSPTASVSLAPADTIGSSVMGLAPGVQVGVASYSSGRHAELWRGSVASAVDLHPGGAYSDSQANAASVTQQAGYAVKAGTVTSRAAVWGGSAGTFVDLHPASGYVASVAYGVSRGRQVGIGYVNEESSRAWTRALMWTGTAGSVVDLSPAGYVASRATRVVGDWAVGDGVDAGGRRHALMWDLSTTPATVIDLQPAADAAGVPGAMPWNLSSSGDVVGVEVKRVGTATTYTPVLWTPQVERVPGDANLDGRVTFTDYQILERNFGSRDSYWRLGDFNDDRVTDSADFALLMDHLGAATASERAAMEALVPEPGSMGWVGVGVGVLLARRGRRWVGMAGGIDSVSSARDAYRCGNIERAEIARGRAGDAVV